MGGVMGVVTLDNNNTDFPSAHTTQPSVITTYKNHTIHTITISFPLSQHSPPTPVASNTNTVTKTPLSAAHLSSAVLHVGQDSQQL